MQLLGKRGSIAKEKRAAKVADLYKEIYTLYASDPRSDEDKLKDLLFTLALYQWERDKYFNIIRSAEKRSSKITEQNKLNRQSAPYYIDKDRRPALSQSIFYREATEKRSGYDVADLSEEE